MDSHYDQVMKAREEASNVGTRKYFGYSTVLDRLAFDEWRQQHGYEFFELPEGQVAVAKNVTLTYDFPSRWWGGRVAGVVDRPGEVLYGRLYDIASKDWPIIAHKEGAVTGMSIERSVTVEVNGQTVEATAFTTAPARRSSDGPISQRFVEALVRGARAAGLPTAYIEQLEKSAQAA